VKLENGTGGRSWKGQVAMLLLGMVVLGLVTFAAMFGFVKFCDRV
jgi:hypothetical protein